MKRSSLKLALLSFGVGAALLGALFFYIDIKEFWQAAKAIRPEKIVLYLAVGSLPFWVATWRWYYILNQLQLKVRFRDLIGPKIAGVAASFLTPVAEAGGAPIRLILARQYLKLPWEKNLASVFLDAIFEFSSQTLITAGGLVVLLFFLKIFWAAWLVLAGMIAFFIWLAILYRQMRSGRRFLTKIISFLRLDKLTNSQKIQTHLASAEDLTVQFFNHKRAVWTALGMSFLMGVGVLADLSVLFYILALPYELLRVFLVNVVMNLAYIFPVPAALGVAEWGQAGFFSAIGMGAGTGAFFSLLYKGKDLFYAVLGVIFLLYSGLQLAYIWAVNNLANNSKQ